MNEESFAHILFGVAAGVALGAWLCWKGMTTPVRPARRRAEQQIEPPRVRVATTIAATVLRDEDLRWLAETVSKLDADERA